MLKKTFFAVVAAAMTFGILPSAMAQMSVEKVCLVTDIGRVNDGTFNQYAYEGMLQAAEEFDIDSSSIETVSETDYAPNIDTCVQDGSNVVITVGFLLADATRAAAEANPDVYFVGVDQFLADGPTNYVGIQFREDQAGFLVGALTGLLAQEKGFDSAATVSGFEIPPVVKFVNGYQNGIAYIDPAITVLNTYIDFTSEDKGAEAALQFIGEGADVIFGVGGRMGSAAIRRAAEEGTYVVGVDQDEYFTTFQSGATPGSEFLITSAVKRVDVGVYDMIAALVNGDMEAFVGGGNYILDVANGGITFGPKHDSDVSDDIYTAVAAIQDLLISGDVETGVDPASGAMMATGTIADLVIEAAGDPDAAEFTVLLAAVLAADPAVLENLSNPDAEFTVFAPTDAAFVAAIEALGTTPEALLGNTELLTTVLMYHVIDGAVTSDMLTSMMADTMQGGQLDIVVADDGSVTVNGANVLLADVIASNGVIHVIDAVLLPPSN